LMAFMLSAGSFAYTLLATSVGVVPILVAVVLGYGFGWGWNGLLMYTIVLIRPRTPAAATGIVQVGNSAGAAAGPLAFGLIANQFGFQAAWISGAVAAAGAAVLMMSSSYFARG
jgi:predicted MFS family arabinose efflux permease